MVPLLRRLFPNSLGVLLGVSFFDPSELPQSELLPASECHRWGKGTHPSCCSQRSTSDSRPENGSPIFCCLVFAFLKKRANWRKQYPCHWKKGVQRIKHTLFISSKSTKRLPFCLLWSYLQKADQKTTIDSSLLSSRPSEWPKAVIVLVTRPGPVTLRGVVGEADAEVHAELVQGCSGFGSDPQLVWKAFQFW